MVKRLLMAVGILAVLSVFGLFAVGTASAQGPAPTPGGPPFGVPFWGGVANGYSVMTDTITKLLGMTWQQVYDARVSGKTMSDIAKSKGITDQQLIDAMLAGQKSVIDQAVKDGRLTQAQADWMAARMKSMVPLALTSPFGPGRFPGGRGPWGGNPSVTTK